MRETLIVSNLGVPLRVPLFLLEILGGENVIAVESVNSDFISKINKQLSTPYLHYHSYQSVDLSGASLDRLWKTQKTIFTQRFNSLNKQGSSGRNFNQVKKLLENWDTNGDNGASILSELQNIAVFDSNGQSTAYGTSGGVQIGDFTVANARSAFNISKSKAQASISPMIKAINESINNIVAILAANKEYLLAQAIVESYYSGEEYISPTLGIPPDTSVGQNLIAVSNNKMIETINTLKDNLNKLAALEGSNLAADPYKASYSKIVGSIKASLNSVGGTMHEIGFTLAALNAAKKAEKELQETNKEIADSVSRAGGTFITHWTAQDTSEDSGSETKDDVTISWNDGNAQITFGGSIKLRQGQGFKGSGPGSQALPLSGFVVRQENLEQNLRKLERYAAGVTNSAASMIAALGSEDIPFSEWYQIKQRLGMLNLVDAIAGTGTTGDFSAILVVNNRIFTIPDILERIGETLQQIENSGDSGKGYTIEGAYLDRMRTELWTGMSEDWTPGKQALSRNKRTWEILQREKISITLNLGYLYAANIFQ